MIGLRPALCPWRSLAHPFVGQVLGAYFGHEADLVSQVLGAPGEAPMRLVRALVMFDRFYRRCTAERSSLEAKEREERLEAARKKAAAAQGRR